MEENLLMGDIRYLGDGVHYFYRPDLDRVLLCKKVDGKEVIVINERLEGRTLWQLINSFEARQILKHF